MKTPSKKLIILLVFLSIGLSSSTLSPNSKKVKGQPRELSVNKGPREESVFDLDLVDEEPAARDIIVENGAYYEDTETRLFNGTILGYVTPWNNHGYDVAKTWGKKFDIISPVWLQIQRVAVNTYQMSGTHDIDAGWIKDIRKGGKTAQKSLKVLPRILFDKFSEEDYTKLISYETERKAANDLIVSNCLKHKFDGVVLEVWSQLGARVDDEALYRLVIEMADALKVKGLKLILVIPPVREEMHDLFGLKHFERLFPHVFAFSLMTYDFSSVQRPGANAPLHWVKTAIEHLVPEDAANKKAKRRKILMGLNMYGNDYTPDGGGPIVGGQFLELVKYVKKRLTLDEHDVENFFEVRTPTGRHIVFYPTLFSINERIKLAREMGVGISIWELGQGLDYFYDLF